jgi:diguanylate cyclase
MRIDLSATGWGRVILGTLAGAAICIAVALYVDSFNFPYLSPEAQKRAVYTDVFLPGGLATTFFLFLLWKIRQLAIAQRELTKVAATDSLTAILNRGAFTMLVESYLEEARKDARLRAGALLIVDADHFKSINDRLGHDRGDTALKLIAQTIKGELRGADIVGRIGGEEFGVFLPGAGPAQSRSVAERIRAQVRAAEFSPGGTSWPLSVSIGGVTFTGVTTFDKIYIEADRRLYQAKSKGRNQVCFATAPLASQPLRPTG